MEWWEKMLTRYQEERKIWEQHMQEDGSILIICRQWNINKYSFHTWQRILTSNTSCFHKCSLWSKSDLVLASLPSLGFSTLSQAVWSLYFFFHHLEQCFCFWSASRAIVHQERYVTKFAFILHSLAQYLAEIFLHAHFNSGQELTLYFLEH